MLKSMKRMFWLAALALPGMIFPCFGAAQDRGIWRATSSNAKSITGDVQITDVRLVIDFSGYSIAQIRQLKPAELAAVFDVEPSGAAGGAGYLYRLDIPANRKFLHKNTLCGTEETRWMATFVEGHTLHLAFLSSPNMPVFTFDALQNSQDLCGTFTYAR
jgi:hypothetical protein